jgi:biopolymer transport protein ExbB/TolQ
MLDYFVSLWELIERLDWLGRGDIALLAVMLLNALAIALRRLHRYSIARRQTRAFVNDIGALLRNGKFDEVNAIAAQNNQSHVANIVTSGLTAFASVRSQLNHEEAIDAATRAIHRRQKLLNAELKVGFDALRTMASTASFVGLLGMCFGILYTFRGTGMEKHQWIARVQSDIAASLSNLAIGLLVAILAMWLRNYVRNCMDIFKTEMSNATIQTIMALNAHREWQCVPSPMLSTELAAFGGDHTREVRYERQPVLMTAIWLYWFAILLEAAFRW